MATYFTSVSFPIPWTGCISKSPFAKPSASRAAASWAAAVGYGRDIVERIGRIEWATSEDIGAAGNDGAQSRVQAATQDGLLRIADYIFPAFYPCESMSPTFRKLSSAEMRS